jgi:sRNA-binding regulator protein Hfq
MAFPRRHHFKKRHPDRQNQERPERHPFDRNRGPAPKPQTFDDLVHPESTGGAESTYLKSLVDSHAKVTVVLTDGEKLHGHIRYYDRYCFSIGLSGQGPRIFLRKDSVSYIAEE